MWIRRTLEWYEFIPIAIMMFILIFHVVGYLVFSPKRELKDTINRKRMKMVLVEMELNCSKCPWYRYTSYYGNDCSHPSAPDERGKEPLAENRIGDVPGWCPLKKIRR